LRFCRVGPGGPFYGARIWLEAATLPANADDRALERVRQIEERLLDAERAAASGDPHALAAAIQAYRRRRRGDGRGRHRR
jgi:hypothetical protein